MSGGLRQYGFTLMEVMLAVTLTVGLVGSVFLFYDGVIDVREAVTETAEFASAERIIMDRITNELRSAMVYPFIRQGLWGDNEKMGFITVSLPGPVAWAVRKSTEDAIPPEHDLQLVGYRLHIEEDEEGRPVTVGLERTEQKVLLTETAEEGEEIQAVLLTERIKFLRLRYLAQADPAADEQPWQDSWRDEGNLPLAVEIVLGAEPLPEGAEPDEYPYQTWRRVVYVPGSVSSSGGGR